MEKIKLYPDDVLIGGGRRVVNEAKVEALVESISKIGLQTPITVWFENPDSDRAHLVTGAHRVEACRRLGIDMDAFVTVASEVDRDLWEIDENLCRSELTEAEEAQHLARRKELWAQRNQHDNFVQTSDKKVGRPKTGDFARETSAITGQSKSTIAAKISRAERIEPEVLEQLKGTDLDKGAVLDQLAKTPREEQRAKVIEIREHQETEKLNRAADKVVARSAADEAAEIIHANLDLDTVDVLMARLSGVSMKDFIAALAYRRAA